MDLVEVSKREGVISQRHPWELARLEVVTKLLHGVIRDEEGFNVMDIGCGDIFFITQLSDLFPKTNFFAVDIAFTNEMIAKMKQEVEGRKIFLFKSLEEAVEQMKGHIDLVLLLDVVEHIEDHLGFLKSLFANKGVNNRTAIMITVPAFQNLFCSHDHFLGHYRRYTNRTLLNAIESAGFKKITIGYFFSSLLPPRILQVLKEKLSKPKPDQETTGLVEWNRGPIFTSFVKGILLMDFKISDLFRRLTGLSLPGLSNYVICKKPAS